MSQPAEGTFKQALPWHTGQWSDWLRQIEAKRLPHAVLISGLPGLGKRHLAEAFSQAVLCKGDNNQRPCGRCKSCRLLKANSHPDLHTIEPEEAGKAIKIAQVRDLVRFLSGTAQQGGWKCVIIEPADAMNNPAANALLKSLEEPPGETSIILVSSVPGRLTATLRSRCRQVPVGPPSREVALSWLEPRVGKRAGELLDYAHGAPCAALAAGEAGRLADRTEIFSALLKLSQAQASAIEAAKRMQSHAGLEAIDQILAFLNHMARAKLGSIALPVSAGGEWADVMQRVDKQLLFRYRDKLIHAKSLMLSGANPNKQLLWEELMFDWQALTVARTAPRPARQMV